MNETFLVRRKITQCDETDPDFVSLFDVFNRTLTTMSLEEFKAYYNPPGLEYTDVTFIYIKGSLEGFLSVTFCNVTINNKPVVIGRSAIAISADARGGKLPVRALYLKFVRYKLFHPFRNVILATYVANPLVYAMICRYIANVYPRKNVTPGDKIIDLKNNILQHNGLREKEMDTFVVKVPLSIHLGKDIPAKSFSSENSFVKYYLSINPEFQKQYMVMVIVPVTFGNSYRSTVRVFKRFIRNKNPGSH